MSTTIKQAFYAEGVALHSGKNVQVRVAPRRDGGIVFRTSMGRVPASVDYVQSTDHCTILCNGEARIGTVEHLMAAAWCADVDALDIEVSGDELPILDGSALPWLNLLQGAGRVHAASRPVVTPTMAVAVTRSPSTAWAKPAASFSLSVEACFAEPFMVSGTLHLPQKKARQWAGDFLAPARTFVAERAVPMLRERGLALGGSLENAVVFDNRGLPLNPGGLRFSDEPLRHKMLDVLGDLALVGDTNAHFSLFMPGHALNVMLGKAVSGCGTAMGRVTKGQSGRNTQSAFESSLVHA